LAEGDPQANPRLCTIAWEASLFTPQRPANIGRRLRRLISIQAPASSRIRTLERLHRGFRGALTGRAELAERQPERAAGFAEAGARDSSTPRWHERARVG
jgi:hypothetical protein